MITLARIFSTALLAGAIAATGITALPAVAQAAEQAKQTQPAESEFVASFECGTNGTVTLPETEDITYNQSRDGSIVSITRDGDIVTVTAEPAGDIPFTEDAITEWTFDCSHPGFSSGFLTGITTAGAALALLLASAAVILARRRRSTPVEPTANTAANE